MLNLRISDTSDKKTSVQNFKVSYHGKTKDMMYMTCELALEYHESILLGHRHVITTSHQAQFATSVHKCIHVSVQAQGRDTSSTSSNGFLVFADVCESTVLYCTHHSPGSFNVWQGQGIYLYFIKYFPCIHVGTWVNRYVIR